MGHVKKQKLLERFQKTQILFTEQLVIHVSELMALGRVLRMPRFPGSRKTGCTQNATLATEFVFLRI